VIEEQLAVATRDGLITTFPRCPERDGPHPLLLFYLDARGIREGLRDVARRYATVGYCVVLPNLYYRAGILEPDPIPRWDGRNEPPRTPVTEARAQLTIARIMADTEALLRCLDKDRIARTSPIACVGCCTGRSRVGAGSSTSRSGSRPSGDREPAREALRPSPSDGHAAWRDDALPADPRRLLDIVRGERHASEE
jgi:carboxymethylenebutenolidase